MNLYCSASEALAGGVRPWRGWRTASRGNRGCIFLCWPHVLCLHFGGVCEVARMILGFCVLFALRTVFVCVYASYGCLAIFLDLLECGVIMTSGGERSEVHRVDVKDNRLGFCRFILL